MMDEARRHFAGGTGGWLRRLVGRGGASAIPTNDGKVLPVWGAIVIANTVLFSRGRIDAPAGAVYSRDPHFDAAPEDLLAVAERMVQLRGMTADERARLSPSVRATAETLADESGTVKNLRVAADLTKGREVYYELLQVARGRLPDGYLADGILPVLTPPRAGAPLEVLPRAAWPRGLVRHWRQRSATAPPSVLRNENVDDVLPASDDEYAARPITLTRRTAEVVRRIAREQDIAEFHLLVDVETDGGGFVYKFDIQEGGRPDSKRMLSNQSQGVVVATPRTVGGLLLGLEIDYRDEGQQSGFVFNNPNEN